MLFVSNRTLKIISLSLRKKRKKKKNGKYVIITENLQSPNLSSCSYALHQKPLPIFYSRLVVVHLTVTTSSSSEYESPQEPFTKYHPYCNTDKPIILLLRYSNVDDGPKYRAIEAYDYRSGTIISEIRRKQHNVFKKYFVPSKKNASRIARIVYAYALRMMSNKRYKTQESHFYSGNNTSTRTITYYKLFCRSKTMYGHDMIYIVLSRFD